MINNFTNCGSAVVRSPLNSFNKVFSISYEFLIQEFKNTRFQEVIFIASPVLYEEVHKYIADKKSEPSKNEKLFISLTKYYQRYCTRCTPFGLFSGVSVVGLGERTEINYSGVKRITRIDNFFLSQLTKKIENDHNFRRKLKYKLNSSLYEMDDSYRYIEFTLFNSFKKYEVTSVDKDRYLEKIINVASGYHFIDFYTDLLIEREISRSDAQEFINVLIDNQILISNLEPSVVSGNPFNHVLAILSEIDPDHSFTQILGKIKELTYQLDHKPYDQELYESLLLEAERMDINFDRNKLLQVDCYLEHEGGELDKELFNNIKEVMELLGRFYVRQESSLEKFKKSYQKRYDTTSQLLTMVLDPDLGINYPQEADNNRLYKKETDIFKFLLKHFNEDTIYLDQKDLSHLPISAGNLQPSLNALFSLIEFEDKDMLFFEFAGGNSANDLFGRFTHLDQNLSDLVDKVARHEMDFYKDFLVADILHLPESRTGNILFRKKVYDYHITYLGNSTLADEFEISINDLEIVILSDTVFLRSRKLDKFIIPRLNNAHNYKLSSLPIYRFLAEIQNQSAIKFLGFDYGKVLNNSTILPRVVFKNIILYPKTWIIEGNMIKELKEAIRENQKLLLGLPDIFMLISDENHLFVNTNNALSVRCFLDEIKNTERVILREFYFPSKSIKTVDGESCTNEIQLPILNKNRHAHFPVRQIGNDSKTRQSFSFGHTWLYFKVYGGEKITEKVLVKDIYNFVRERGEDIEKWFFLRYYDEEYGYHLRIRFLPKDEKAGAKLNTEFIKTLESYLEKEYLRNVAIDTYRRELSRYQTNLLPIEYSETFFSYDSDCILEILKTENFDTDIRVMLGMLSVDHLLASVDYDLETKLNFCISIRDSFAREFGNRKFYNEEFNRKYRETRNTITLLFTGESDNDMIARINALFEKRSSATAPLSKILKVEEQQVRDDILASYIHMSLNRLFLNSNRLNEYMVYDFIVKQYTTIKHKSKVQVGAQVLY